MTDAPAFAEQRRRLVEQLLRGQGAHLRIPGEAIEPRDPRQPVPLSAEQSNVWFHASMAPDVPLYNEPVTIHRTGPLDVAALECALNEIVRRHEIWRTSFDPRGTLPRAVVHPALNIRLRPIDLSQLSEAEREQEAERIATAQARQPFDLEEGPLLRTLLVHLAGDRHRLYLTLHHLIFDGVSLMRVMMPELAALYAAYAAGKTPNLPPPRLQYGDYAVWRERQFAGQSMARELGYWRHKLAGELPELALPTDRRAARVSSHRGSMETFTLSPELTTGLKSVSRELGVTLYTLLLAAFKALLHRYSGQDDIVIGGVTDMRHRPELENVIGYFLNGIALRSQPCAGKRFCDYLAEVQTTVVEALDASTVPFDRVVREVCPRRDGGRHPLFQVLFSIQPPPAACEGWRLAQMDVTVGVAKFDLYLELEELEDSILGRFLYSTDLFEAATIRRMIGHWLALLHGVIQDPACTLDRLPLLSAEERRQLLADAGPPPQAFPDANLDSLIRASCEEQALRYPAAIAVECGGQQWSYAELERHVARLTQHLRAAGAGPGTLVAIAMERSPDLVAGLLAILRTGAAYLPLDPALPSARLQQLLEDAQPAVLLSAGPVAERLPRSAADRIDLAERSAGDLAYVLYTSGSTARPKAVEITHRSLVNLLTAMQRDLGFTADDSFLAVTTISFDIAALELFLPLLAGGRLVLATRDEAADPSRLMVLLARAACTVMQATPATWRALVAAGWGGDDQLTILCGGEALSADLARSLAGLGARLWNMYGPTETTVWSLRHEVDGHEDPVPIGRPLANTRAHVLDAEDRLVPVGVPGELCIGGAGLARGYRNEPALTAAKFVADPFEPGKRLYRTGDRVRRLGDGAIEFLGRVDNQVKLRGFRVGLEEVEDAIAQHPRIAAAAARIMADRSGEASLVGYLVLRHEPAQEAGQVGEVLAAVRDFLRERLPGYMVPSRLLILPHLPTTPNGKVDRKRLPQPPMPQIAEGDQPRDDVERALAQSWCALLGLDKVGIHDSFFDLGGHSLLAFMLAGEIKSRWNRDLPLSLLFQAPTIAGLAQALRSAREPRFSHLVELRKGVGRPLFIVHGVFGDILQLRPLAEQMRTTRPVYAIQARGADPGQPPHASIAEMAEAYLAAIRDVQPSGPYALAGYSFGGLIAYEMGRRLRANGKDVEFLALLETDLHERYLPPVHWLAYHRMLLGRVFRKIGNLRPAAVPAYLRSKASLLVRQIGLRFGLRDPAEQLAGTVWAASERRRQMFQIGIREFVAFRPQPYDGKLSLFHVTVARYGVCNPVPIWRRAARSIELIAIDGDHDTIMEEPFVRTLASVLGRCLAAVGGSEPVRSRQQDHVAPESPAPYSPAQAD